MTAADLITEALDRGVELVLEGQQVRFRAQRGALTVEFLERLRENKHEILTELRRASAESQAPGASDAPPVLEERILYQDHGGVEVVEVQGGASPPFWEKRLVSGCVVLVGDHTTDPLVAQGWVTGLRAWDAHRQREGWAWESVDA